MFYIDNCLISDDLINTKFCCNLADCKGACCIEGDEGAPLEANEVGSLEDYKKNIFPFMTEEGIDTIKKYGVFDYGVEGDYVTPLIKDRDCAYICFEGDIAMCAIEKAYKAGEIPFNKPISCHLYPVRLKNYSNSIAINVERWNICDKAYNKGDNQNCYVYEFLKEPLIRRFGEEWYNKLVKYIKENSKTNLSK
ncbi:MAG: DUF3109 family protein [Bacteroidales bacterium]|jgi:hypothetical protein